MIILDRLITGGLKFVFDKIASAVDAEMNDERSLKQELLEAQMQLELGEMEEEEFVELERDILARLREVRAEQGEGGAVSLGQRGFEVEVNFGGEGDDPDRGGSAR
ncbi:MAG TPA: gas vesicle protein GvpG [Thermoanaerobaculia bacterium]|nr:gas vesicle protein GvpG [Thermoanaerobaculia bacterium]